MLLVVSVLLHLLFLDWADGHLTLPSLPEQNLAVIMADLQSAQVEPQAPPLPHPKSVVKTKRKRHVIAQPNVAAVAVSDEIVPIPDEHSLAAITPPVPNIEPEVTTPPTETVADEPAATPEPLPEIRYKINPPPPAELKYDVEALREGQIVHGHGTLRWQHAGDQYTASGDAGILFFSVLNFKSNGVIDDFGISPVLYSEKRFRKSETNTHFQHERNTISFSASELSYPRKGGEQDRATIIWQLAGIGRGDNGKFVPGTEIDIFVAGVRDAETWHIQVIGEEEIIVDEKKTNTWHVVRIPKTGSYDQKIDIWFAPQQAWYPVKLRYTEKNGDYLDMALSKINPANS